MAYLNVSVVGPVDAHYNGSIDMIVVRVGISAGIHLDLPGARMLQADLDKAIAAAKAVAAVSS